MTDHVIEHYDTFYTIGCPYELIFGDFNDQPIPSNYYNFLNDDNEDGNKIPVNPVYSLVGYCTSILYNINGKRYVETDNLSFL